MDCGKRSADLSGADPSARRWFQLPHSLSFPSFALVLLHWLLVAVDAYEAGNKKNHFRFCLAEPRASWQSRQSRAPRLTSFPRMRGGKTHAETGCEGTWQLSSRGGFKTNLFTTGSGTNSGTRANSLTRSGCRKDKSLCGNCQGFVLELEWIACQLVTLVMKAGHNDWVLID